MATHSSIPAWSIPWTKEPGGLQSWGCKESLSTLFYFFPGGSDNKESAYNVGDLGSIPGLGRCPGEGNTHSTILGRIATPVFWPGIFHGLYPFMLWRSLIFLIIMNQPLLISTFSNAASLSLSSFIDLKRIS